MPSPRKHKDKQSLTGRIAALSRFVSKATGKCISFFNVLRGSQRFEWSVECEEAFQKLKEHLAQAPVLAKPVDREPQYLFLVVTEHAISAALVREDKKTQLPVYYVSKRMLGAESRYPVIEKLTFFLLMAFRKLRPYFQADAIKVMTNHPLRQVLQKPKSSGRLLKWVMELSQFDIAFVPRVSIKRQALADFIVECSGITEGDDPAVPMWKASLKRIPNQNGKDGSLRDSDERNAANVQEALHPPDPQGAKRVRGHIGKTGHRCRGGAVRTGPRQPSPHSKH
ncbi:uncharacterized protein LOC133795517 [Humulus lupulus]|uniref:uncharacterized protein LOC133795517 n=1 Tax=Humulus lupulus TaxID=3486 RepID=UPI002B40E1EA|nr:uncharacterized protein LOC133795517 [Humulus lupulus]